MDLVSLLSTVVACCVFDLRPVAGQVPGEIKSVVSTMPGHYPGMLCRVTYGGLNATGAEFGYIGAPDLVSDKCSGSTLDVWPITGYPGVTYDQQSNVDKYKCDEIHEVGVVFTIFYWAGASNYYHLHYDMALPLFKFFNEYVKNKPPNSVVLMPSVETTRLQRINWDTNAFDDKSKYWFEVIKLVAGERLIKPLNRALLEEKKNLCFTDLYFGTIKHRGYGHESKNYIKKFVNSVWKHLKMKPQRTFTSHRIAIISRKNRRRILNEEELVEAVKDLAPVDLLSFEKMTVKEQIQEMQNYTVLVGVNGAGLMNGLYLPPFATAVQLVPHNASVNWKEFGELLEGRGPYLVYHNPYPERSVIQPHDKFINNADTNFHPEEFREVISKALDLALRTAKGYKDEL